MRPRQGNRAGRRGDRGLLLQQSRDLLERRDRRLQRVVELRHLLHRREEPFRVQQRRDEHPHLQLPGEDPVAVDREHGRDRHVADQHETGVVDTDQSHGPLVGEPVVVGELAMARDVVALAMERLHGAVARHRLDELHDEPRRRHTRRAVVQLRSRVEPAGEQGDGNGCRDQHEPAPGIEGQQHDRDEDHEQQAREELVHTGIEKLPHRVEVGRLPRDDATRGVGLVELEAEPLRVAEHAPAQLVQRRLGDARAQPDRPQRERAARQRDGHVPEPGCEHRRGVAVDQERQPGVDHRRDEQRPGGLRGLCRRDEQQHEAEPPPHRPQQRPEQPQRSAAHAARERPFELDVVLECHAAHATASAAARAVDFEPARPVLRGEAPTEPTAAGVTRGAESAWVVVITDR